MMKSAAIIYSFVGLALFGIDVFATFSWGLGIGTAFYAVFGTAFLLQARGLYLGRRQARLASLFTSGFIAVAFGSLAIWFYATALPTSPQLRVPHEFWWLLCSFAAISLTFGLVFLMLLRVRVP
jgi:hypothetical protein